MTRELRTKKFINGWAQIRIAVEVVLHSLLMVTLIAWILFAPPFVTAFSSYGILDHQAVANDLFILNSSKWPLFLLLALFIGMVSVLFSHHIVGPAFQIRRIAKEISERKLTSQVKFRKWDYMVEVEDEMNHAITNLKTDISAVSSASDKAMTALQELRPQLGNSEASQELDHQLQQISTVIKSYQL